MLSQKNNARNMEVVQEFSQFIKIAWENKDKIESVDKKSTKLISDLRNEIEQLKRRNDFDIEEKVKAVMYESIQESNISRNKIMDQTRTQLIRAVDEKIESASASFDAFITKAKSQQEKVDAKIKQLKQAVHTTNAKQQEYNRAEQAHNKEKRNSSINLLYQTDEQSDLVSRFEDLKTSTQVQLTEIYQQITSYMTRDEVRAELILIRDEVNVKDNEKTPERSTEESHNHSQGQEDFLKGTTKAVD